MEMYYVEIYFCSLCWHDSAHMPAFKASKEQSLSKGKGAKRFLVCIWVLGQNIEIFLLLMQVIEVYFPAFFYKTCFTRIASHLWAFYAGSVECNSIHIVFLLALYSPLVCLQCCSTLYQPFRSNREQERIKEWFSGNYCLFGQVRRNLFKTVNESRLVHFGSLWCMGFLILLSILPFACSISTWLCRVICTQFPTPPHPTPAPEQWYL